VCTKLFTSPTLQELLSRVDILALTETHHFPNRQLLVILGYQHFAVARPCKVGGQVRKHNGGILIYVSELCNNAVSVWKAAEDGTRLWLKFTDLGNSKPLFLCITYVPPQNSPYVDKALYDHIAQEIVEAESTPGFVIWLGISMLALVKRQIRWIAHRCVMFCKFQTSKTPARR
jgi:hypothetical protein